MDPSPFPPCRHRGGEAAPGLRRCHAPKLLGPGLVTARTCGGCYCRDHAPAAVPAADVGAYRPRPGDPPAGVVVGAYKWPRLVELQVRLIRHTCGPVPILVSDDCSPGFGPPVEPGGRFDRLQQVCAAHPDVTLWPNVERIGHAGGDLAACWKGLVWARARGLAVLAKLSQRFLLTL